MESYFTSQLHLYNGEALDQLVVQEVSISTEAICNELSYPHRVNGRGMEQVYDSITNSWRGYFIHFQVGLVLL